MEGMKSVVIGDDFFVAGFLYSGFDKGIIVRDKKDIRIKIDNIIENDEIGLIVISKALVVDDMDYISKIKCDSAKPLVIEIAGYGKAGALK